MDKWGYCDTLFCVNVHRNFFHQSIRIEKIMWADGEFYIHARIILCLLIVQEIILLLAAANYFI